MIRKSISMLALLLTLVLVPSAYAQSSWSSPEDLRTEYMRLLDTLSQRVPESDQSAWATDVRQKISDIQHQVNGLSSPMLDQLSRLTDRQSFTQMVDAVATGASLTIDARTSFPGTGIQSPVPVTPQSAIVPPDYSSAVAGTTCSETPTSAGTIDGEKIGLYVDRGLSIVADVACQSLVVILGEGTNIPACVLFGITRAVEVVLDSLIDHQEFCNSLLDGANADATSANVITIHGDVEALDTHLTTVNNQITGEFTALDTHVTNVDNHIAAEFVALDTHLVTLFTQLTNQINQATALLGADLKQVMKLELTPEGLRRIVPAILTCTGTDCPNVLANCPAAGCYWNNVGPLP